MKEFSLKNDEKIVVSAKKSIHKLPFLVSIVSAGVFCVILLAIYFWMQNRLDLDALVILSFGVVFFIIFAILIVCYLVIHLNKNSPLILTDVRLYIYNRKFGYAEIELKDLTSWTHKVVPSYSTLSLKNTNFAGVFYFEAGGQKYRTFKIKNYEEVISALDN
ncbi:MAG: hypothetical protein FWG51_03210 [Firmicutes bacterium]|nr:hypothetical protein [Bacillota bacterium]